MTALNWLPELDNWRGRIKALPTSALEAWPAACSLAKHRLSFIQTNALDGALNRILDGQLPPGHSAASVRLAILGSCTTSHLHAAIRVAGLRRGMSIEIYEASYGQYWQELSDADSALHAFRPTVVLFALDAHHLAAGVHAGLDGVASELEQVSQRLKSCWQLAKAAFACPVIQQTVLPVHVGVLGNNEHRMPGSKADFVARLNAGLRDWSGVHGVDLLAVDRRVERDGLAAWFDPALWFRSKQEITLAAAPLYGDLLFRIFASRLGRSSKCLVLDLDHTVWGGVVGDDGVEGLVLGQGSALGEAFVAFQQYAKDLSQRGVILAVCSKNDESNAVEPFLKHPEMVLRRGDIACFVANWHDKASNLRSIAQQLNIGLDSLVFVDDNPFERALVRQELPMVEVPEISDDPVFTPIILADAGYFEGLTVTDEDRQRSSQYQGNLQREAMRSTATDLPSYLRGLEMQLLWRKFDVVGLSRVVQLINKTNQFNLTTRRYTEHDVQAVMSDASQFGLQLRLVDRFGDNGIIAIVIGRVDADGDCWIDTWLMSCRVLGRQVEPTTLNLIAATAKQLGAKRLIGEYLPTKKNAMVSDHYRKLGFSPLHESVGGASQHVLALGNFEPKETFINVTEE